MGHRDDLLGVFHLESGDLEANRAGKLGEGQARRLVRSGYWNVVAALFGGICLAAILYWVARKPLAPVQWILASGLFLAALAVGIGYMRRTRAAVAEGRVECVTGPVRAQRAGKAGWYLHVADRSFRLPVRPGHVRNGMQYRVYFAPRADVIVAMEPEGWD